MITLSSIDQEIIYFHFFVYMCTFEKIKHNFNPYSCLL